MDTAARVALHAEQSICSEPGADLADNLSTSYSA